MGDIFDPLPIKRVSVPEKRCSDCRKPRKVERLYMVNQPSIYREDLCQSCFEAWCKQLLAAQRFFR